MIFQKSERNDLTEDGKAVLSAFEKIQKAMIDKDINTLYSMTTPDKTFTHMSGKTQTREEYFGEIADGILNYFKYNIRNPAVEINGEYACLTSDTTLTAKVYGISGAWTLHTKAWFRNINGAWIYCNKPE